MHLILVGEQIDGITAFFAYLKEMIEEFFAPLGEIPARQAHMNDIFNNYVGLWDFWGWFFFILFLILQIALAAAIVFLVFMVIRAAIGKNRKGDVAQLRAQIEQLNFELYQAIAEKDRILGLQVNLQIPPAPGGAVVEEGQEPTEEAGVPVPANLSDVRFPKLTLVDEKYAKNDEVTILPEEASNIDLRGICERFRLFAASQMGLYYTPENVRAFIASMGVGKIIILEGISGTGKTSLPYCFGRFLHHNATIVSVQPSWHDRSELLGYYNDFTKKFTETEFLRAIYEATYRDDLSIIVLDEMNLARIEYYFAEFLSIMEMPNASEWNIDLVSTPREDDPKHLHGGRLLIPQNIIFIGTANNDDSTFTITDKVYDRAMSLFFDNKGIPFEAEFTQNLPLPYEYLNNLFKSAKLDYPLSEKTSKKFAELDEFVIENFKLAFGNRILKQLGEFVPCYVACGGTELGAVDYIFQTKILKKFEVLNVGFMREQLINLDKELTRLFGKNEFPMSRKKIKDFLKVQA